MADLYMYGPALAYDDATNTILGNAQFFLYSTYDNALADAARLPVFDENGIPVEVLRSTATGVIPRWQATVRKGYVRAGDNIQGVYSGEGLDAYASLLESRIVAIEGALAMLDVAPDGALRSDDFDFEPDGSRANSLLLYAAEDDGDDIEIVVDPTRENSLLLYDRGTGA